MGKPNFSDEFKRDAVAQITERGYPVAEVSQRLGVSTHSLYAWKRQFAKVVSGDAGKDAEIRQLKRELARVTEERDILKKANRVFRQGCKVRYAFIAEHRDRFGVRAMCRCLAVQPSGYYAWRKEPLSRRACEDARQTTLIRQAWNDSGRVYGYRKLHDDLLDQGETCCPNRVARLTKLAGIKAQIGYRRRPGSHSGRPSLVIDNALARQFDVEAPDRVWVTDITYIRTMEGFSYLAVVIDLYSRRVVGWSMQSRQTSDVVLQALHMAIWRRKPKSRVLIHSDQGSQFTSMDWTAFIRAHNLEHSMSRRGNCHDNAVAESFFSSLKRERIRRRTYKTRQEARQDVFDYIEMFYNPVRKQVRNGMLSPVQFEQQQTLNAQGV
ncbi:IS3 family transposase (plasmid) [Gluconobacter sphaericus]|uniref:IS3 family transposase n=1 Tax=Gluconobacter sphaericus TaxID=574987 RepID=UPI0019249A0A|nr:IS3 family transposase [Gluconobacter sphaericus]QQX90202.1 IS3 family transposase [Gluconobacter sphaericus]QQX90271.1 IS3 family transposase [Gluconobacter sphaericus]QQX90951.1 IS3 family transposase [Gluconobacter sphaericus]QQX92578.1 IS3 family transposase [Gluconobacter sphaericus]QQX92715.1 IS3 family transposase [Gluconobacter sphaericus]